MSRPHHRSARPASAGRSVRARAVLLGLAAAAVGTPAARVAHAMPAAFAADPAVTLGSAGALTLVQPDTLAGRSGKLRARFLLPGTDGLFTYLRRALGDTVGDRRAVDGASAEARSPFTYIAMLPFARKVDGRIGEYRIGFWPGERGRSTRSRYENPRGFIQVTSDNAATPVSEHFRLRDFLTHDQARVWPKYLVLDEALVDKLELVLSDLRARGYRAERLHVMSGFRTPQYNRGGGDARGRAELSRHQYGDAADVWVENGDGTMADLDGDGWVDARDAAVLAESADRVEQRHPELTGGVGVYRGTRAHGPFVHIDTRGSRARWGHG